MKKILPVTIFLAVVTAVFLWKAPEPASLESESLALIPAQESPGGEEKPIPERKPASAVNAPMAETPLSEGEKKAVGTLVDLIAHPERVGSRPRALFDALGQAGLKPIAARDSNEYTGTMWVVRTDNALPGTRYFHAQLFGDEQESHMQHVSFEVRPGSDSMETALQLLRQAHPSLGAPEIEREDYVLWKNGNGRVISVKRIGPDELETSRFNARSAADVGAVWVVSEDDPEHGEG